RGRDLDPIERTVVSIDCVAPAGAITRWLTMVQTPLADASPENADVAAIRIQALPIRSVDLKSSQSKKDDDVRARVIFDVVRVHEIAPDDEDEG
ncbi:MAG: hypothetical protein AAGG01_11055, partial [Planctomycetota bacterium]